MKEFDINEENDNIIKTSSDDLGLKRDSSADIEEVDQDKIQIKDIDIKAEYTSVSAILPPGTADDLQQKDYFEVIKFTIKLSAVHDYKWEVYHKPSEIKSNLEDIVSELDKKHIQTGVIKYKPSTKYKYHICAHISPVISLIKTFLTKLIEISLFIKISSIRIIKVPITRIIRIIFNKYFLNKSL